MLPAKTASLEDLDEIEAEDEHGGSPDMSPLKHTLLTLAIVISGFTIAYFVDDLQMGQSTSLLSTSDMLISDGREVLSFVGSTGSTTISFILPGLFYWKVRSLFLALYYRRFADFTHSASQLTRNDPDVSRRLNRAALALAIYGICVCVFW